MIEIFAKVGSICDDDSGGIDERLKNRRGPLFLGPFFSATRERGPGVHRL